MFNSPDNISKSESKPSTLDEDFAVPIVEEAPSQHPISIVTSEEAGHPVAVGESESVKRSRADKKNQPVSGFIKLISLISIPFQRLPMGSARIMWVVCVLGAYEWFRSSGARLLIDHTPPLPLFVGAVLIGYYLVWRKWIRRSRPPVTLLQWANRSVFYFLLLCPVIAFGGLWFASGVQHDADTYYSHKQYDKAAEKFGTLNDFWSVLGATTFKVQRADCLYHLGEYQRAIDIYTAVLKSEPTDPALYLQRGKAYDKLGSQDKAARDLAEAQTLGKKLGEGPYAQTLFDQKQYDEALAIYDKLISEHPKSATPYVTRGKCYAAMGRYQTSIKDFDRAISLYPKFGEAYYRRGLAHAKIGMKDLAESDRLKSVELGYKHY
jgi:hypothetical protein